MDFNFMLQSLAFTSESDIDLWKDVKLDSMKAESDTTLRIIYMMNYILIWGKSWGGDGPGETVRIAQMSCKEDMGFENRNKIVIL